MSLSILDTACTDTIIVVLAVASLLPSKARARMLAARRLTDGQGLLQARHSVLGAGKALCCNVGPLGLAHRFGFTSHALGPKAEDCANDHNLFIDTKYLPTVNFI